MPEYVYSIIVVVILIVFFAWWTMRKRNEVWKGELIEKKLTRADEDNSANFYLVFKTEDGKKKRFSTYDEKYWASWDEGDMGEKRKGEFFPVKI